MDTFGKIIERQHRKQDATEIIERSDGLLSFSDPQRYFDAYDDWDPQERHMISMSGGRTLDIGCGAGRHSLYLQEQGLSVTATDVARGCVRVTRSRGVRKAIQIPVERIGDLHDEFDSVLMLGMNLGLLGSARHAPVVLHELARIAAPGGQILGTTQDYSVIKDRIHREYRAANRRAGHLPGRIRLRVRFETEKSPWFDYLFLETAELRRIIAETPWSLAESWTFNDHHYGHRLIRR